MFSFDTFLLKSFENFLKYWLMVHSWVTLLQKLFFPTKRTFLRALSNALHILYKCIQIFVLKRCCTGIWMFLKIQIWMTYRILVRGWAQQAASCYTCLHSSAAFIVWTIPEPFVSSWSSIIALQMLSLVRIKNKSVLTLDYDETS